MQPVLIASQYKDLYRLLLALPEAAEQAREHALPGETPGVILWSDELKSSLLDSSDKLEVIDRHAARLNIKIILAAASDPLLRHWAQQLGWTVFWDLKGFDNLYHGQDVA